jgi:hypothetical protein
MYETAGTVEIDGVGVGGACGQLRKRALRYPSKPIQKHLAI